MTIFTVTQSTPLGSVVISADGEGKVTAVDFVRDAEAGPGGSGEGRGDEGRPGDPIPAAARAALDAAARQLAEYFRGKRKEFRIRMNAPGTPFRMRVWEELGRIPYGEVISYGELARRLGRPGSARAVGLACGSNPIAIVVPCHRVVGSDGRLTGYASGLDHKRRLLEAEGHRIAGDRIVSGMSPAAAPRAGG